MSDLGAQRLTGRVAFISGGLRGIGLAGRFSGRRGRFDGRIVARTGSKRQDGGDCEQANVHRESPFENHYPAQRV